MYRNFWGSLKPITALPSTLLVYLINRLTDVCIPVRTVGTGFSRPDALHNANQITNIGLWLEVETIVCLTACLGPLTP